MSTLAIDGTVLAALIGAVAVVFGAMMAVAGAVAGSLVTTFLNMKVAVTTAREVASVQQEKHRESREWELRRVGYSVVLARLGDASEYAARLDNGYNGPGADPEGFDISDRGREHTGKMWDAWAECESEFRKNRLTCSEAFASNFREIADSLEEIYLISDPPPDEAASVAKCFEKAHSVLLSMALEELDLKSEKEGLASKPARE